MAEDAGAGAWLGWMWGWERELRACGGAGNL